MVSIPSLDLDHFRVGSDTERADFVASLSLAFHEFGFVAIKNHLFSEDLQEELYGAVESFFLLPDSVKQQYEKQELFGQRGYIGKKKEHAKGRSIGDLKEFYHVGQEDSQSLGYPANIWPTEVPGFQSVATKAFKCLEETGLHLLRAIAISLKLEEEFFEDKVRNGNSILRPIHYFPLEKEVVEKDAVRAAAHGDINLITLLMGASAEGLEILSKQNEWIPVTALPGQLIVNVGDMLERLTNHRLRSTIHRVVNPTDTKLDTPRYSIPFFMHPKSDMDLTCLETCIDGENPKSFDDITAGEFLNQRLVEIGLKPI